MGHDYNIELAHDLGLVAAGYWLSDSVGKAANEVMDSKGEGITDMEAFQTAIITSIRELKDMAKALLEADLKVREAMAKGIIEALVRGIYGMQEIDETSGLDFDAMQAVLEGTDDSDD